jgi:antitoxin component of MazEF toxin-antitoxin module
MVERLVKSGNSLTLVMPPEVVEALGLDENTALRLEIEGQRLTITPADGTPGADLSRPPIAAAAEKSHQRYAKAYERLAE